MGGSVSLSSGKGSAPLALSLSADLLGWRLMRFSEEQSFLGLIHGSTFEMLGNPRLSFYIELSSGRLSYQKQSLMNCHSFAPLTRFRRQFFMHVSTMVYMRSAHLTLFIKIAVKISKWECQVRCHDSENSPSAACCHGFALSRDEAGNHHNLNEASDEGASL